MVKLALASLAAGAPIRSLALPAPSTARSSGRALRIRAGVQ